MKLSKLIGISLLTLLVIGTSEARTYVNFGFGVNVQERPRYVEHYYYPQERVVVQHDPYGRVISEHVYVTQVPAQTVYIQPVYRPVARPFFSFGGFFR